MNISETIELLKDLKEEHGDLIIFTRVTHDDSYYRTEYTDEVLDSITVADMESSTRSPKTGIRLYFW